MRAGLCWTSGAVLLLTSGVSGFLLGIDLGSQFFKAAVVAPGKPFEIVHNQHSKRKTPTAVSFNEKVRAFGDDAIASASRGVPKTPMLFPLQMGRNFTGVAKDDLAFLPKQFYPYSLSTNASGSLFFDMGEEGYTVEEVTAHLLSFAKGLAITAAESSAVTEAVMTIPSQATFAHRRLLVDAATIAGLPRPQLVHETAAAALQRAPDLVLSGVNGTANESTVLFYNMGARHVEACVVHYRGTTHMGKPTVAMNVLGCAISEEVGGHLVDMTIAQEMLKAFQAKHPKLAEGITGSVRALKKLEKEAVSLKHVLSANKEGNFRVEALYEDTDFSKSVKREELEQWCATMFAAVSVPIGKALELANVTLADVDEVEMVGGGWRIPKVQSVIAEHLLAERPAGSPVLNLSQHLNGEESMATGAAWFGANASVRFNVKRVFFTDATPHGYSLELTPLNASQPHEDGWAKSVELFSAGSSLRAKKTVKLHVGHDVRAVLFENGREVVQWNISGMYEASTGQFANLSTPLLSLKIELDASGIVRMSSATAIFDEPYLVEIKAKKPAAAAAGNGTDAAGNATEGNATEAPEAPEAAAGGDAEAADKAEEGDNKAAEGDAAEGADGGSEAAEAAEASAEASEDGNSTTAGNETEGKQFKTKIRKRKHPLIVAELFDGVLPRPLLPEEIEGAVARLAALTELDAEVHRIEAAKNSLESFIYESRDKMNDDENCQKVSTEEAREEISQALMAMEDWMYEDEARDANVTLLTEKLDSLRALVNPIRARAHEIEERETLPEIIQKVKDYVNLSLTYVEQNMTWVDAKEREGVANLTAAFVTWYANVTEQQESQSLTEEPAYSSYQVKVALSKMQSEAQRLMKIRKIDPIPYQNDYSKYGGYGKDDPYMNKYYQEMMKNMSRNGTNGSWFGGNGTNYSGYDSEYMRSFYEHAAQNFGRNGSNSSYGAGAEGAGADAGAGADEGKAEGAEAGAGEGDSKSEL